MKLILDERFPVLGSQTFGVGLLGLLGCHQPDNLFPFEYGVALTSIGVDQDHHVALPALHVPEDIFEVWFVLVLVVEIDDLLFEQFPLEHILDGQLVGLFDDCDDVLQLFGFEHCVRFDDGHREGKVHLFGVEKDFLHSLSVIFSIKLIIEIRPDRVSTKNSLLERRRLYL